MMMKLPVSELRVPWPLLVIVLLASTAAGVSAAGAPVPASMTADLGGDGAITYEAADLSEAHAPGLEEEMRSMESLLHWAICKSLHMPGTAAAGYPRHLVPLCMHREGSTC